MKNSSLIVKNLKHSFIDINFQYFEILYFSMFPPWFCIICKLNVYLHLVSFIHVVKIFNRIGPITDNFCILIFKLRKCILFKEETHIIDLNIFPRNVEAILVLIPCSIQTTSWEYIYVWGWFSGFIWKRSCGYN